VSPAKRTPKNSTTAPRLTYHGGRSLAVGGCYSGTIHHASSATLAPTDASAIFYDGRCDLRLTRAGDRSVLACKRPMGGVLGAAMTNTDNARPALQARPVETASLRRAFLQRTIGAVATRLSLIVGPVPTKESMDKLAPHDARNPWENGP
jgi:hypothetical protein